VTVNQASNFVMHRYLRLTMNESVFMREPYVTVIDPHIILRSLALALSNQNAKCMN